MNYIQSDTSQKDSLFEEAQLYFENADKDIETLQSLSDDVNAKENGLASATKNNLERLTDRLENAKKALKAEKSKQQNKRIARLEKVLKISANIVHLSEGDTWEKTQVNSAKLLGTLQLLSPGEGNKLQKLHQTLKPAYKTVVAMRLLDKLLKDEHITDPYICEHYDPACRYSQKDGELTPFQENVAIPIIIAALFQDVGLLHPASQLILKGEDGSRDEFSILEMDDRVALLRLNHAYSLDYIKNGLGVENYIGNSKDDRSLFNAAQQQRMKFMLSILKSALKPKLGVGNLIKVPQIYASYIFSSKPHFDFMDLPKALMVIAKAAERDAISKVAADSLLNIMGHFPQGFGVTYIPTDQHGNFIENYEYAIVTGLNPANPYVPICRVSTRNLTFIANGQIITVDANSNLFFPTVKKRLEKISPERLRDILRKLVSNFEERKDMDLIPSYWNPHGFFSFTEFQNLWKKS